MISFLVDTDICIYAMTGRVLSVRRRFAEHYGELGISSVVMAQLVFGAEKSIRREQNMRALDGFLANLLIVPFDAAAASHYGQLRAHLERQGTPCGEADVMIGAHARSLGLTLVTNNRREFDRMPELKVENWVE